MPCLYIYICDLVVIVDFCLHDRRNGQRTDFGLFGRVAANS